MTEYDLREVHKSSRNNKEMIEKSKLVGCFYCLRIYLATEVKAYRENTNHSAKCIYCSIDSLIPDSTGYPIDEAFLKKMRFNWFNM